MRRAVVLGVTGVFAACNLVADLNGYEILPGEGGGGAGADGGSTDGGGGAGGTGDGGGGVGGQGGEVRLPCGSMCTGDHIWTAHFSGFGNESVMGLAVDQATDVTYVGGEFFSEIDIGVDTFTTFDSERELFITALDAQGMPSWNFVTSSQDDDHLAGITIDTDGNIVGVGHFENQTNIGGNLFGDGTFDLLFFKLLAADGSVVWADSRSGGSNVNGSGVTTHPDGGFIVVGDFLVSLDLDGGLLSTFGNVDAFMAHFDSAGAHVWSQSVGGPSVDRIVDVATDRDEGFVVVGTSEDAVDLGVGPLPYVGGVDLFVAKYDKFAVHQWGASFGGAEDDVARAVAVDGEGRVYVVGEFRQTISFGGDTLTSLGDADAFIAVFDADGNHLYSSRHGDDAFQSARAVHGDTFDNALVGGEFSTTIDFGTAILSSGGTDRDIFLYKLAFDGTPRFSKSFGNPGAEDQRVDVIRHDALGNGVFAGAFDGTVNFGDGPKNAENGDDIYIVKVTK